MSEFWAQAAALVWGPVTVALLMGTGIYFSFRLKFTHLRHFRLGWRFAAQGTEARARTQEEGLLPPGDISPWQSMMTMLAGVVGNCNIAGVATPSLSPTKRRRNSCATRNRRSGDEALERKPLAALIGDSKSRKMTRL
jgi:hypothetical protein